MTDADLADLRRTAENPLARPSERVAARRALAEMGEGPKRRGPIEPGDALLIARVLVRAMGEGL